MAKKAEEKAVEGTVVSETLAVIIVDIRTELAEVNRLAKMATPHYMKVADLLIKAREEFPGDKEFGRWRAEYLPEIKSNWAGRLMQIRQDNRLQVEHLQDFPISVLAELTTADDKVVAETAAKAETAAETPTVSAVRAAKREAKGCKECGMVNGHADGCTIKNEQVVEAATAPKAGGKAPPRLASGGGGRPAPTVLPPETRAKLALKEPNVGKRIAAWDPDSDDLIKQDPFIALGIGSQFTDTLPNPDIIGILQVEYMTRIADTMHDRLDACCAMALEIITESD